MKQRRLRFSRPKPSAVMVGLLIVALLLGVLGVIRQLAPPTTADYRKAASLVERQRLLHAQLESASADYAQAIVGSMRVKMDQSALAADAKDEKAVFDAALADYIDTAGQIENSPAKKDDQVKVAVQAFSERVSNLEKDVMSITSEYDEFYQAYGVCDAVGRFVPSSDVENTARQYNDISKECLERLKNLRAVSTDKFTAYATELSDIITKKREAYTNIAKKAPGNHSETLAQLDMRLVKLDPVTIVQRIRQDVFSTRELNALEDVLKQKLRQ